MPKRRGRVGLLLDELAHEVLKLLEGDLAGLGWLHLGEEFLYLLVRQVLTLSAEALLQILARNETRIVRIKVMERKQEVILGHGLAAVNAHCEELCVVDLAIVVQIDVVKHLLNLLLRNLETIKGLLNLIDLQRTTIVLIQFSESISELHGVEAHSR